MSLSNPDMAVAEKISNIVFAPEKKPVEQAPAPAPEPQEATEQAEVDETPQEIDEPADGAETGDDVGSDDEDTSPVDDNGSSEPSVTPPSGLTADELAAFADLPPAAQKAWARRDQERTKELRRLQNRQAEDQKALAAERQQIATERQKLAQAALQFGNREVTEFQAKYGDVTDIAKLAAEDPQRFLQFQADALKVQAATAQQREIEARQQQEHQQNVTKFRQEQNEILRKTFTDDETFNKFDVDTSNYLLKQGFSEQRIIGADAQSLLIAHKALKWDQAQAARKAAESKKPDVPPVVRPGAKLNVDQNEANKAALQKKLRQSGSVDDASKLIATML